MMVITESQVVLLLLYLFLINNVLTTPLMLKLNPFTGSPVFIRSGGRWTQLGLVSWGADRPDPAAYDVNTDLSYFKPWINRALSR